MKTLKRVNWKDLQVGNRYIIIPTGCKHSCFSRSLIFVGFTGKQNKTHFTFAKNLDEWKNNFGYICSHTFKFYED